MIIKAIRVTLFLVILTAITGVAYPFAVTAVAQLAFPHQANGSLVRAGETVVGSELIAQNFAGGGYFHPRPSGAGAGYEANNSGASNLGVTSKSLNEAIQARAAAQKQLNGGTQIPVDLVTASGSGLDPDITPQAALYQAQRVAKARNMAVGDVEALVQKMTKGPALGLLGMPRVNVLAINRELDRIQAE